MSFTERLAERALEHASGAVPREALDAAKRALVDTLAVALAARDERVVRSAVAFVTEGGAPAGRSASIWGTSHRADPARAAFVNGTAAHALDFDDFCWAMNTHASTVLWPAALAVAEAFGRDGRAALHGYVAGFEASAALGAVLGKEHYGKGWHPTSTIGTLGAAVTAGTVLGLDATTLRAALGIAVSRAAGSRANFGTDTKPLHAGFAAEAGVVAALLAGRGVTANPSAIEADMGLGALYAGTRPEARSGFALVEPGIDVKPYPSCRFTHRVIDGVLALRERRGARTAAAIECEVDPFALGIVVHHEPSTGLEGKFSFQYCARLAWTIGFPGVADFTDTRVAELRDRRDPPSVSIAARGEGATEDEETITVRYTDGTADTERVGVASGSPRAPLSRAAFERKVVACAGPSLGETAARRLPTLDAGIDGAGTLRALLHLLTGVDGHG